jgi:hypothetical protein
VGIITSKDIDEDKVLKFITATGSKRSEIIVRDLMTPQMKIEVLDLEDIRKATVGDVIATLKRMGRQHALVIENSKSGEKLIRGVLSSTQIAKQSGVDITTTDFAGSFADLQASIA